MSVPEAGDPPAASPPSGGRGEDGDGRARAEAARLGALGQMAGELLHDLNGALAVMKADVQLARAQVRQRADPDPVLARVEHDVEHLAAMVRDVFDEVRGRLVAAEVEFDAETVARRVVERWVQGAGVEVQLRSSLESPVLVCGRVSWFSRALANLLRNAGRHARRRVRVELARAPQPGSPGLVVSVEDDGRGVPPELEARLFQPFARGAVGTGLGLSMVAHAATQLRGSVRYLRGAALGGARFEIWVPVPETPMRIATRPGKPAPLTGRTISLVEDEPAVRDVFTRLLQRSGAHVHAPAVVGSGADAARLAAQVLDARPDLVLLDRQLGARLHGEDVAVELRRARPALPILLLSGDPDPDGPWPAASKVDLWEEILRRIEGLLGEDRGGG
jgi:CheY-like chemotaxis protein/two-component sensor histidine kinase